MVPGSARCSIRSRARTLPFLVTGRTAPVPFTSSRIAPNTDWAIASLDRLRMLDLAPAPESEGHGRPIFVPLDDEARELLMVSFALEMQAKQECAGGLMSSAIGKARGL